MDETSGRRETHDFMNVNVESFSQLPFIRRAPVKEKGAIRLFGKDFGAGDITSTGAQEDSDSSETTTTTTNNNNNNKNSEKNEENLNKDNNNSSNSNSNNSSSSNSRRFECHYCFRNFPTSQALGGHQNAHKRERQHAKRGATYLHHHHHHNQADATHVYGFLNHNNYYHQRHYLGGSYGGAPSARLYGGQTSSYYAARSSSNPTTPPTINGSPLGLWRVPPSSNAVHGVYTAKTAFGAPEYSSSSNHSALPLLATEHETSTGAPWYGLKGNVQDHVSLDLHL